MSTTMPPSVVPKLTVFKGTRSKMSKKETTANVAVAVPAVSSKK